MLIEMHCHTVEHSSCSTVPAAELVRQVYAKRLQGLVLTDHHFLWQESDLAALRRETGVPEDFAILTGQETNVPQFGDVLIYGAQIAFPRGTLLSDIRRECPDCAIIWAHPYRDGREPTAEMLCSALLDGVEIFNSNHTVRGNSRGLRDWRQFRFTATSGTDTHAATYAGIYPTVFEAPVRTVQDLVCGIKLGKCRPFLREIRHREASKVTEVKIGTEEAEEARQSLIIRTPSDPGGWSKAERAFHIMAALAGHGFDRGLFRVPQALDKSPEAGTLIEQGVAGVSLFDKMLAATPEDGREYLQLSARWLARLHRLRLQVTSPEDFLTEEARRLNGELARFSKSNHPYRGKVAEIVAAVQTAEQELVNRQRAYLVQGHGDYQPQNIIMGQDDPQDRGTLYLAAIDFERSQFLPPAFDVGWFLAQYRSQFATHPEIRASCREEDFLEAYSAEAGDLLPDDFRDEVELFRARTNISIAAFLVKMGLGASGELWRILVEAERALTGLT